MAVKVYAAVALVGAFLVALGFGLWHLEIGLVVGGVECIAAAYVAAYLTRAQ